MNLLVRFSNTEHRKHAGDRDRLQLPAGAAVLHSQSPYAGSGTTPADPLQWSDQLGKLISGRDRRVFQ